MIACEARDVGTKRDVTFYTIRCAGPSERWLGCTSDLHDTALRYSEFHKLRRVLIQHVSTVSLPAGSRLHAIPFPGKSLIRNRLMRRAIETKRRRELHRWLVAVIAEAKSWRSICKIAALGGPSSPHYIAPHWEVLRAFLAPREPGLEGDQRASGSSSTASSPQSAAGSWDEEQEEREASPSAPSQCDDQPPLDASGSETDEKMVALEQPRGRSSCTEGEDRLAEAIDEALRQESSADETDHGGRVSCSGGDLNPVAVDFPADVDAAAVDDDVADGADDSALQRQDSRKRKRELRHRVRSALPPPVRQVSLRREHTA